MRLSRLASGFPLLSGARDPEITSITEDSRQVRPGGLFVAIRGTALDGHEFLDEAIARGATAVIVEHPAAAARLTTIAPTVAVLCAESSRGALATVAARFYEQPARELTLIGFTGTFGKTTTSDVLRAMLAAGGQRAGVLGSLGARYESFHEPSTGLTTPAPVELHRQLRRLRAAGADTVIMEVTTHALLLGRVEGLTFSHALVAAILPGEHTDFHRTYDEYVAAKQRLLHFVSPEAVLAYDRDNPASRQIAADAGVRIKAGLSTGAHQPAAPHDLLLEDVRLDETGAQMRVGGQTLRSSLLGRPNVRNVGLALTLALAMGIEAGAAGEALPRLIPLRRRLERFGVRRRTVLDDTAGHAESLRAAFEVAGLLPHEHMIVVYAVRGNRGAGINRRNAEALAELAAMHAVTNVIVTAAADHTGSHDRASRPEIDQARGALEEGGCSYAWHDSLAAAVKDAAVRSAPGDLVLLLGAQGMNQGARLLREELGDRGKGV